MTPGEKQNVAHEALLGLILKKFPKEEEKLQRLFQASLSFQSLCEDYRDCLAALQYWQQAASPEAPETCQSYAELLQELEQEVQQYLDPEKAASFKRKGADEN